MYSHDLAHLHDVNSYSTRGSILDNAISWFKLSENCQHQISSGGVDAQVGSLLSREFGVNTNEVLFVETCQRLPRA